MDPRMPTPQTCPCGRTLPQGLIDPPGALVRLTAYRCPCGRGYQALGGCFVADGYMPPKAFQCPRCGIVSCNPDDAANGYCGRCNAFTGPGA